MTDREKIIAEIEWLLNSFPKPHGEVLPIDQNAYNLLGDLKLFIESLPAEQASEELEEEIDSYLTTNRQYAGGDEEDLWGDDCIRDAIKYGTKWQKEQMMKNCLYDTEVMIHTKLQNTEYLILANSILPHIPVSFGLNVGDKVKILIIKEA